MIARACPVLRRIKQKPMPVHYPCRSYYYYSGQQRRSEQRAAKLVRNIRIVKPQPVPLIASLLRRLFSDNVRHAPYVALR